jgi:hypothetical protein
VNKKPNRISHAGAYSAGSDSDQSAAPDSRSDSSPIPLTIQGTPATPPSRRQTLQWLLATIAATNIPSLAQEVGRTPTPQENAARVPERNTTKGYGTDPDLMAEHKPGAFWPLTLTPAQKKTATALADTIIPADHLGPAASQVGSVEMIDEWISAPYPDQLKDRPIVLEGLAWLETESTKRFNQPFPTLTTDQKHQICNDIAYTQTAKPDFKKPAEFFARFRWITAAAYYATPAGWDAIGYVGNVALPSFEGPPPEVLQKLGVTQTIP